MLLEPVWWSVYYRVVPLPQQIQHLLYTLKADYILPSPSGLLPGQWPNPLPEHNTAAFYGEYPTATATTLFMSSLACRSTLHTSSIDMAIAPDVAQHLVPQEKASEIHYLHVYYK